MSISEVNRHVYVTPSYSSEMKKKNPDTFGGRVAELRADLKLSQKALAKLVGIKQPSLSAIENNETTVAHIRAETMARLAMHLRTTQRFLARGEGSPGADSGASLKKIVAIFPHLSDEHKGELVGYAEALYAQELARVRKVASS